LTFCLFDDGSAVESAAGRGFRFDLVDEADFELADPELESLSLSETSSSLSETRSI